jgi:hypothetical protein
MPDEKIADSATGNVSDELPKPAETSAHQSMAADGTNEKRKARRFRVGWHADILFDDQSTHQGYINDISTLGASFFLDSSSIPEKSTLHIHVPPLNLTSDPHIIVVSGKTVYVVYDGDQQLYRVAFSFLKFHKESDLAYLDERLTKYEPEIQEMKPSQIIVEL